MAATSVVAATVFHQASMLELPQYAHSPPQAMSLTMSFPFIFYVCLAFSQWYYFNLLSMKSAAAECCKMKPVKCRIASLEGMFCYTASLPTLSYHRVKNTQTSLKYV